MLCEPPHQPAAEHHEDHREHLEQHHVVESRRQHIVLAARQVHARGAPDGERGGHHHEHLQRTRALAQPRRLALDRLACANDAHDGHEGQRQQEPLRDGLGKRADEAEEEVAHDGHRQRGVEEERRALEPRYMDGRRPDDDDPPARKPQQGARRIEQPHAHHRQHRHERERRPQRRHHADRRNPQRRLREPPHLQQRPGQQVRQDGRCDDHEKERRQLVGGAIDPNEIQGSYDHVRREEVQHPDAHVEYRRACEEHGAPLVSGNPFIHDSPSMGAIPWCQYRG